MTAWSNSAPARWPMNIWSPERRSVRLIIVFRRAEGAVLVPLERDDVGTRALGEIALVDGLLLCLELPCPVPPDAAQPDIDGPADQADDDDAEDDRGHRRSESEARPQGAVFNRGGEVAGQPEPGQLEQAALGRDRAHAPPLAEALAKRLVQIAQGVDQAEIEAAN